MSLVRRQWRRLALYLAVREGGTRMVSERSTAKGGWGTLKNRLFLPMVRLWGGRGGIWGGAHLMVLPVRMRIHWGRGRFCFCFLPSFCLILKVFWDGC